MSSPIKWFVVLAHILFCGSAVQPSAAATPAAIAMNRTVLDFLEDFGAVPSDSSHATCKLNSKLLTKALQHYGTNRTIIIPYNQTFHLHHGVSAKAVNNSVLQIDGTLRFVRVDLGKPDQWHPPACITIAKSQNVTLTSRYRGLIDGRGSEYWRVPYIGYLESQENRPRLVRFNLTTDLLIENIILQDSPYHTLYLEAVNRVEIRNISIVNRRTPADGHSWIDLSAFNTDGIDVSGHNVHVHDVDIWTQDDCIAVKDNFLNEEAVSSNMTFERVNASGLGFVIGSIGGSTVKNITFRDSYLHQSVKGLYMKFVRPDRYWKSRNLSGLVEDVVFENIVMEAPSQWPIWIGPAQQADARNPCHPNPCSLCWPMSPGTKCHVVEQAQYRNLSFFNITINNPKQSPGVILGSEDSVIKGVVFDTVQVTKGSPVPYALEERTTTFPGLKQPIVDKFVPSDYATQNLDDGWSPLDGFIVEDSNEGPLFWWHSLVVVSSVVLGVLGFAGLQAPSRKDTTSDSLKEPLIERPHISHTRLRVRAVVLLEMVLFVALVICHHLDMRKPRWKRTNRYFRCEGVEGGVATGNTWPVPACFADKTLPDNSWTRFLSPPEGGPSVAVVATGALLSIVVFVHILTFALQCWRRQDAETAEKRRRTRIAGRR